MNLKRLNSDLTDLIEMRNELAGMNFNDDRYDDLEEDIHACEDGFLERYGETLEDVLEKIHLVIAPDNDVLLPTAYLARRYHLIEGTEDEFEVDPDAGILLETMIKNAHGKPMDGRLVIMPSPFRFVLNLPNGPRVLWSEETPDQYDLSTN